MYDATNTGLTFALVAEKGRGKSPVVESLIRRAVAANQDVVGRRITVRTPEDAEVLASWLTANYSSWAQSTKE